MRIFISAGEPSGDLHGASLARALQIRQPEIELIGFGGEHMAEAGVHLLYPLTDLAVMWLGEALRNIDQFLHLGAKAESLFRTQPPDAVVLIDYPGFHWHIAQRAARYGVPVYYFVPPQLWAWAGWRVKKVQRYFRAVLTALPFEEKWYRERGVRTHYVGHPYFDAIGHRPLDDHFMSSVGSPPEIVGVLPGSRTQEVVKNFPAMLRTIQQIHQSRPQTVFFVAAYREKHAEWIRHSLGATTLPIQVYVRQTPEIIALSTACIAVSGSVTLELMYFLKPTVIVYQVGRLFRFFANRLKTCDYISLVNLLAEAELFPEFASVEDRSTDMAQQLLRWLEVPETRLTVIAQLQQLRDQVARPGAADRAAEFLLRDIASIPERQRGVRGQ